MAAPEPMPTMRQVNLDDAELVADLFSARTPDDPRDGAMLAFFWTSHSAGENWQRLIAVESGVAIAFIAAGHDAWQEGSHRFGNVRPALHPTRWSAEAYLTLAGTGESWLHGEGAQTTVARLREDRDLELAALDGVGYKEVRRTRVWRLDLARGRDRLLGAAERSRAEMQRQGVRLLTLDVDSDPDVLRKLYVVDLEATSDIPTTVPIPVPTFEEWRRHWFDDPGHRSDRIWIARDGGDVLGLSAIGYPVRRGIPWTSFTGTSRKARGRGIARALKYETVAQAIALGAERIETSNDAANAPILHLNKEMGYEPTTPVIELHRDLTG